MNRHVNSSRSVSFSSLRAMASRTSCGAPASTTASMGRPSSHVVVSTRRVLSSGTTDGTQKSGWEPTSARKRSCDAASRV